MLDPASSVEMVKVLEEDPMVGGVGGDVQVHVASLFLYEIVFNNTHILIHWMFIGLMFCDLSAGQL